MKVKEKPKQKEKHKEKEKQKEKQKEKKEEKKEKEKKKQNKGGIKSKVRAAPEIAEETNDDDDAESALCFGAPNNKPACRTAAHDDNASAATWNIGGEAEPCGLGVEEDDGDEDDPEDDISPNDSVSNIGVNHRLRPPRHSPARVPRKARAGAAAEMPSIVEQRSAEMQEDVMQARRSPAARRSPSGFLHLGDLDSASCGRLQKPQATSREDDGFSCVHEKHMAMRNMIPGDEIKVSLTGGNRQAAEGAKRGKKGARPTVPATSKDDDANSDVTFNFDADADRVPLPLPEPDDGSDVGSAVTFNFSLENPKAQQASKQSQRQPAPQPERRDEQADEEEDDDAATFDFSTDMAPRAAPRADHGGGSAQRRAGSKQQESPQSRTTKRAPQAVPKRAAKPLARTVQEPLDEDDEKEVDMDDDTFTSVGLSSHPRDPYLGLRGGRLMGGGLVSGVDGKWCSPGCKIAHPPNLRYGDTL